MRRQPPDNGFTLIELMVVVLVIGILVAIGVPTFAGARTRADDGVAKAAVNQVLKSVSASRTAAGTLADATAEATEDSSLTYTTAASTGPKVASVETVGAYSFVAVKSNSGACFSGVVTPNSVSDVLAATTSDVCSAMETGGPVAALSGLSLWLDASYAPSLPSSTPVSQWRDRSPKGNDVSQTTSAMRPALATAAQNGRNVVRFDGTTELTAPDSPSLSIAGSEISVFAVYKSTVSGQTENDLINKEASWELALVGDTFSGSAATATPRNWGWIGSLASTANAWHTGVWTRDSANFNFVLDGTAMTAAASPAGNIWPTTNVLTIGGRSLYTTYRWVGDIAEIVVVNRKVTDGERDAVLAYLAAKWHTN